jgi:hypothetical protein
MAQFPKPQNTDGAALVPAMGRLTIEEGEAVHGASREHQVSALGRSKGHRIISQERQDNNNNNYSGGTLKRNNKQL